MSEPRESALLRLHEATPPGPWKVCRGGGHQNPYIESAEPLPWNGTGGCSWAGMILESRCNLDLPAPAATLALVVAMHRALPALCEVVRAARELDAAIAAHEDALTDATLDRLADARGKIRAALTALDAGKEG